MASLLRPDYLREGASESDSPQVFLPVKSYEDPPDPPAPNFPMSRQVMTPVIAGESLTRSKPVFSLDAKYVFVCCANAVRVFVNASGQVLRDLLGHRDAVTSVCLDPQNRFLIFSSSLDCSIILWDYEDGIMLKRFSLDTSALSDSLGPMLPVGVLGVFLPPKGVEEDGRQSAYVLISRLAPKPKKCHPYLLRGSQPRPNDAFFVLDSLVFGKGNRSKAGQSLHPEQTDFGCDGRIVASIQKSNQSALYIYDCETRRNYRHKMQIDRMISVSCHPHLPMVAVGCVNGKILVINDVDKPVCTRVSHHWHSLPVTAVAFTRDGTHFLSGGHERVLVRWNLTSAGDRQYIPRLGAEIERIAVSPENFYAVSMADNCVNVFGSTRVKTAQFQGMVRYPFKKEVGETSENSPGLPAASKEALDVRNGVRSIPSRIRASAVPTGLHRDPRTNHLVLNGHLGQIQFFDPTQNRLVNSLDVLNVNFVSADSVEAKPIQAEVNLIAFDAKGEWLVTVEQWKTEEISQQVRLKVWRRPLKTSASYGFSLNTVVNKPHSREITQVAFRPIGDHDPDETALFATTGMDGKFKLWSFENEGEESGGGGGANEDEEKSASFWANDVTNCFQNQIPVDLDFSEDGSVVGVAFGRYLTLWTTEDCQLKDSHLNPDPSDSSAIVKILFGLGSSSHLIVYATASSLVVYDILTLSVSWFEDLRVSQLVRDPFSAHMVAFEGSSCFVFKPNSKRLVDVVYLPRHESTSDDAIGDGADAPISAIFLPVRKPSSSLPVWQRRSRLVFLNRDQELVQLKEKTGKNEKDFESEELDVATAVRVKKLEQKTLFGSLMMAEDRRSDVAPDKVDFAGSAVGLPTRAFVDGPLATPAHVLPPVATLCKQFHALLLKRRDGDQKTQDGFSIASQEDGNGRETLDGDDEGEKDDVVKKDGQSELEVVDGIDIDEEKEVNSYWDEVLSRAPVMEMSWLK